MTRIEILVTQVLEDTGIQAIEDEFNRLIKNMKLEEDEKIVSAYPSEIQEGKEYSLTVTISR